MRESTSKAGLVPGHSLHQQYMTQHKASEDLASEAKEATRKFRFLSCMRGNLTMRQDRKKQCAHGGVDKT
eukprot:542096-Amphidinium_carterae.1